MRSCTYESSLKFDPIKHGFSRYLFIYLIIPKRFEIAFNKTKFIKKRRKRSQASLGVHNNSIGKSRWKEHINNINLAEILVAKTKGKHSGLQFY